MNYKNAALAELEELANKYDDYTMGKVILSVLKRKPEGVSTAEWLFEISDEDMYTEIERTILIEANDGIIK